MQDMYYVQAQARRMKRCISTKPVGEICEGYLRGMDAGRFVKGVEELRGLLLSYYGQAEVNPASLNLPCVETESARAASPEAREGVRALTDFPAALFAMGASAAYNAGVLTVDIAKARAFFSKWKCKYLPEQLSRAVDFGFSFEGFDGKKLPKAGEMTVYYPDNPDVAAVLTAIGDKLNKDAAGNTWIYLLEPFIQLAPGLFADDTGAVPEKNLTHFIGVVGPEYERSVNMIVEALKQRGLTLTYETLFQKNRFFNDKGKDSLTFLEFGAYNCFWKDGNENLFFRLKLNKPEAYMDAINALPPHLFRIFDEVWCGHCAQKCNRRITYRLNGTEKEACGCFSFAFRNPSVEDVEALINLYDLEQQARSKKKA